MQTPGATTRKLPLIPVVIGAGVVVLVIAGLFYLNRPAPRPAEGAASPASKAYLRNLELKDVTMKATENFMKQQVVEVEGSIGNTGPRPLQLIAVYCLFYGVDGAEIHRERALVLQSKTAPLNSGETRHFRLPFDNIPPGWNQTLPKMVIAQIDFAQ